MPFARWHGLEQSMIVCDGVVVGSAGWTQASDTKTKTTAVIRAETDDHF
ncbi:MAG: hypothetical protein ACR2PA_07855 [Hyphomicrobiaceae bacterium]